MLVSGVLVVTTTTAAEVGAWRGDAIPRWLDDRGGAGASEARFFFGDLCLDFFLLENEGNEDRLASTAVVGSKASEAVAAIDEFLNV